MPAQLHAMKEEKAGHEHVNTPTPDAREIHVQEPPQKTRSSATLKQVNDVGFYYKVLESILPAINNFLQIMFRLSDPTKYHIFIKFLQVTDWLKTTTERATLLINSYRDVTQVTMVA